MRRVALVAVVVLVCIAVWALWPGSDDTSDTVEPTATVEPASETPQTRSPARPAISGVTGLVRRDGKPVADARVVLKSLQTFSTQTETDGTFAFTSVAPGAIYLSATADGAASSVQGPLILEAGARLQNVIIDLTPAVTVSGVVVDFVHHLPIAKAVIVTTAGAVVSDVNGAFTLSGPIGQTWVDVSAVGYLPRSEWVALELARAGSKLELVLTPVSRIEGEVMVGGAAARNATVFTELARGAHRGERSAAVMTNEKGHFELECPDGRMIVTAYTKEGARVRSSELVIAIGETRTGVILEANDLDSIGGIVTRADVPLPNASVTIIDARTNESVSSAITGLNGQFRSTPVVTGTYVVQVRAGDFVGVAGPFEHRLGGGLWTVALTAGQRLTGRVEPPSAGIRVRWRSGDWVGPAADTVTDALGKFAFEGVSEGLLSVDAEGTGGAATAKAHAGDDVVLRLEQGFVIARLADSKGVPLSDGMIFARSLETGVIRRFMVLAPDGSYRFELASGPWELELEVSGRGRSAPAKVEVTPSGVEVRLTLEPGVVVRGHVRDAVTKLPLSGALIRARSANLLSETASVLTNARGEFTTPELPRSNGITVSAPGYKQQGDALQNLNLNDAVFELAPSNDPAPEPARFEGIGMTLDMHAATPAALSVIEGSPAERAGVLPGDLILSVDGAPAGKDLNELIKRIRGPSGTAVRIGFERAGKPFELVIRRRLISPM